MTGIDNNKFGPGGFFSPSNDSYFICYDIDNNGINDLIGQSVQLYYPPISDTSKNGQMYNIQRFGIPIYMKFDSSFNITYYHENFRNPDVLFHQPDFYAQADLNKDGVVSEEEMREWLEDNSFFDLEEDGWMSGHRNDYWM